MAEVTRTHSPETNIYYESRMFVNSVLPFSLHIDIMVNTSHHYVHKHKELEILKGISGSGVVYTDMKPIEASENDIIIANPNRIHYITSDKVYKYYCLIIDSDFLSSMGIDAESVCLEDHIKDPYLSDLMDKIYEEWSSSSEYRSVLLRSYVSELLILLLRNYHAAQTVSEKESKTLKKIKQSITYIKNNYKRDITLDEISSVASLSRYHFCREFKKATNLTPVEFINRTRCELAKELLESKKYTISDISELCGFATTAHFSKTFKGFFGSYPSEFVKKLKNEPVLKETKI